MQKIIDLSKPIKYYPDDSKFMKVKIKHKNHKKGSILLHLLGFSKKLFPKDFKGWADDTIKQMGVHAATHMDAPWHYGPKSGNEKAKTIDEIPLEWCYGPGVVLDFKHKKDMEIITREDIQNAIAKEKVTVTDGTIVMIKTGNDKLVGTKQYMSTGTGVSGEATEWLIDQGVKVMGIDQWGWDLPLQKTIDRVKAGENPDIFWEGHRVGLHKEYCHIEQVVGLDQLPASGFKIMAMPLPLVGCSAAPIRLVAILEEEIS